MNKTDLSIIIPAYNCGHCISTCLDSVLRQENADKYDIIVVNDGSKDATAQSVQQYQTQHKNIRIINQPNSGVSFARSKCKSLY